MHGLVRSSSDYQLGSAAADASRTRLVWRSDVRGDWDKDVESEAAFSAELTRARLTNEQCKTLVPAVGKKLLAMTR